MEKILRFCLKTRYECVQRFRNMIANLFFDFHSYFWLFSLIFRRNFKNALSALGTNSLSNSKQGFDRYHPYIICIEPEYYPHKESAPSGFYFISCSCNRRHIHVETDMPPVRGFRHVCNRKCLVEHPEHFNATHSCKKEIVKNVVHIGLEVVNKVQENLPASNI